MGPVVVADRGGRETVQAASILRRWDPLRAWTREAGDKEKVSNVKEQNYREDRRTLGKQ
jgi:hypothetical protein